MKYKQYNPTLLLEDILIALYETKPPKKIKSYLVKLSNHIHTEQTYPDVDRAARLFLQMVEIRGKTKCCPICDSQNIKNTKGTVYKCKDCDREGKI
jgi:NADH pyrophosphatase NudC (nudix superfamily)|tara:strand:- start:814 stop:1101 length:288 start_codon:yes stop_codon:yes gene_type:complete